MIELDKTAQDAALDVVFVDDAKPISGHRWIDFLSELGNMINNT